jgi:hypothetical protein
MPGGARGGRVVAALAEIDGTFTPEGRARKRELLAALATAKTLRAGALRQLHESLCFLQAYPDDGDILARVDQLLRGFPDRLRALPARALGRLHDSGIAGSTIEYPFGLPMSRWLATRLGDGVDVAWSGVADEAPIAEALDLLVTPAERDAFSEGGITVRQWVAIARAGRPLTDLQVLIEAFDRAALEPELRDWLYESLALPIRARLDGRSSRTFAKGSAGRLRFQRAPLRRSGIRLAREATRPLTGWRRASPALARDLVEIARIAMATRSRELHAFSYPNPDDVIVGDLGRGLQGSLIGLAPASRLPFEGYYAFLVVRNGVPVAYGGGWCLFDTLEFGFNVFESFRQGESAFILGQVLRAYHHVFRMRTVVVDPYQLGAENLEALRSGAFYFYHRLGFRPRDPEVLAILDGELAKIAVDRRYRSPIAVLRRLARGEAYLTLPGGSPEPERRVRARELAGLVTREIARQGDRRAAVRTALRRVAGILSVARWKSWPEPARKAFETWALVLALVPSLERWSVQERRSLVRLIRAKSDSSEGPYVRRLARHARLRRSLAKLIRQRPAGT